MAFNLDPRPPESGQYETAFLASLFFTPAAVITREIATRVRPDHFAYGLHRSIYHATLMECRQMAGGSVLPPSALAIRDRLGRLDDEGYQGMVRGNLCRMVEQYGPLTPQEQIACIQQIVEIAGKRKRYEAACRATEIACDPMLRLDEIDQKLDALWQKARKG